MNFLNVYGPGLAILFVVFVEAAGVFWFYGVDNFSADVEAMLGERPGLFWRICWQYISPVFLLVTFWNGYRPQLPWNWIVQFLFDFLGHFCIFTTGIWGNVGRGIHLPWMEHSIRMGVNTLIDIMHPDLHHLQGFDHSGRLWARKFNFFCTKNRVWNRVYAKIGIG